MKIAILASTSGTNLPSIFDQKSNGFEFILITNKSNCGAIEKAKQYQVPFFFIDSEGKTREQFDQEIVKILENEKVEFIFLVGYMRIISRFFTERWKGKILNIHPSLLPAFAGGMDTCVHEEVLKRGCKITGATLHYVTEEVDGGPIFSQKACKISKTQTPETLKTKVQKLEQKMLVEALYSLIKLKNKKS